MERCRGERDGSRIRACRAPLELPRMEEAAGVAAAQHARGGAAFRPRAAREPAQHAHGGRAGVRLQAGREGKV